MKNDLISKRELSIYLGVSIGKIDSMMNNGLPYLKIGRIVRFKKDSIEDYLEEKVSINS